MTKKTNRNVELNGSQFLYGRPEALHSAVHAALRYVVGAAPMAKAQGVHVVPLLVGEFAQAMMHYPIVFGGPERTPMAIMGLREEQNMFVKDGCFEDGAYVPAYLRRYPFTLAGAGDDQFVVCIDRDAPGFVEGEDGEALFAGDEPTEFTRNAIAFLNEYEVERKRTQEFVELLVQADLFEVKHTLFVAAATGEQELIADYYGVAEEKLHALDSAMLGEMVKHGAVAAIDAHLLSLSRWSALIARREQMALPVQPAEAEPAPEPEMEPADAVATEELVAA